MMALFFFFSPLGALGGVKLTVSLSFSFNDWVKLVEKPALLAHLQA